MKIHIDPRQMMAPTDADALHVKQLMTTAMMLAGNGASAALLLIAAVGEFAALSDQKDLVLEGAIRCFAADISPDWQERVNAALDAIDRERGRTS